MYYLYTAHAHVAARVYSCESPPTCMTVESTNRTTSFAVSPGTRPTQSKGANEMMTVGTAKTRENKNVTFQLRMVRAWPIPELAESPVARRALKPAPCGREGGREEGSRNNDQDVTDDTYMYMYMYRLTITAYMQSTETRRHIHLPQRP